MFLWDVALFRISFIIVGCLCGFYLRFPVFVNLFRDTNMGSFSLGFPVFIWHFNLDFFVFSFFVRCLGGFFLG